MSEPLVSIITSTYNRSPMLRRAVESVRAQTFTDWEHIIVGDCTPDDTEAVVASFNDPRLRFFNLPEKSPPGSHGAIAKNHGIQRMARGGYIAYLDDDDRYRPLFLEVMMGYLRVHPDAALAYCRSMYRDKDTGHRLWGNPFQRWLHGYSKEKLRRYNFLNTNCVIHKKSVAEEVGGWDPGYYFDDYELWLRISERHDFHYVNRVLVETFVSEPSFLVRAVTKGWRILRHGRTTPVN
ncbi:MAG TPA: glycosyltransferase [Kiritimatiellia bacterium]|nr:glycosyltransferase [Kiritimatiellia bacterium]HRZ11085.1 glycosyltransferase [Kiritimatiellia bacterium]HSA18658.1 glycosyltransferase [Kiritimatiellia bacterium]